MAKTLAEAVLEGLNIDGDTTPDEPIIDGNEVIDDEDAQAEEVADDAGDEADQDSITEDETDGESGGQVDGDSKPNLSTGGEAQGDGKPDDELAGLSERARKRFADLTAQNRQQMVEIQQHQQIRQMLNESIGDPADFVVMLDYAKAVKTGNYQQALEMLDTARNNLVLRSGIDKPLVDPLSAYPDLLAKVNDYSLDRAVAIEIAQARKQSTVQQQQQQRYQQDAVQQQQQYQREVQTAVTAVGALEAEWSRTDPDYKKKMQIIQGQVNDIAQRYYPEQWAGVVKMLYDSVSLPPVRRKVGQVAQPLRAGAGAGGGSLQKAAPQTMEEAIMAALG